MKKNISILFLVFSVLLATALQAQPRRYHNEVFNQVEVDTDIAYGYNYSILTGAPVMDTLLMDVYYPEDDTVGNPYYEATRPLIILTHAGSFLPKDVFLPFGYKNDSMLIEMCTQFAKRGWVAVSMTYRIGWNPLGANETIRKSTIINAVYRAMQDMKACVRWFRKSAAVNGNPYRIDPYRVVAGGTNSGGYISIATATLNKPSELTLLKFLDTLGKSVIDTSVTGGFFGEGGCMGVNAPQNNPGYSSAVQAVLNMGGAIGDTTWLEAGEPPIISFHGVADPLTPYRTAVVIVAATGQPVVEVSGSHDLTRRAVNVGNHQIFYDLNLNDPYTQAAESRTPYEGLLPFFGAANGFEPWAWYDSSLNKIARPSSANPNYTGYGSAANPYASRAKAELYIDSIINYFTPRVLEAFNHANRAAVNTPDRNRAPVDCSSGIALRNIVEAAVEVYPNPASANITTRLLDNRFSIGAIRLLDISGKELMNEKLNGEQIYVVRRNALDAGVYFINIQFRNGSQVFRRVIFE